MNIKQKILRFLIENKEKTFSINEISKALKIDYKLVYTNTQKLEKEETIKVEDFGNIKRCSFEDKFNEDVFIVENERKKELLKNKNLKIIYLRLNELKFPFIALLFGSYAKGNNTKKSDIDLLIITENEKDIEEAISLIPLKIHLTTISYKEFIDMARTKEFSVVTEALKKNIILVGIEEYYRLLKNVG